MTKAEHWTVKFWRPFCAITYLIINIFDFIIAPLVNFYFFGHESGMHYIQWSPMTLQGGGTFHIAFGAILGVTAWSRGQEKIAGVNYPREDRSYYDRGREQEVNKVYIHDLKKVPTPETNKEL
jgi:hypothetical protein